MKKIATSAIFILFSIAIFAQLPQKPLVAEFRYNESTFNEAIKANNVSLFVSNLDSDVRVNRFKEMSGYYATYFTTSVGEALKNGERECKFNFKDNKVVVQMLMRLLLSNDIHEVIFDGKKTPLEEFFAKYK